MLKVFRTSQKKDKAGRLPEGCTIVGSGRRDWDRQRWLDEVRDMVRAKARGGLDESDRKSTRLNSSHTS